MKQPNTKPVGYTASGSSPPDEDTQSLHQSEVKEPADKRLQSFRYYGGKNAHLNFLLPKLPESETFIEPYGGSGAVLLNRKPSPIEVYNDLDSELVNFFRVLRHPSLRPPLIKLLSLTPYSREEYLLAIDTDTGHLNDLERAARFFTIATQVRDGLVQCAKPGNWSYARSGINNRNLEAKLDKVANLPHLAKRFLRVTIENRPALDIIARYDSPGALFYLDPTYLWSTRTRHGGVYHAEMTDADHRDLARVLKKIKGKAAISGYDSPLYRRLYGEWTRHEDRPKRKRSGTRTAQEILWTNY